MSQSPCKPGVGHRQSGLHRVGITAGPVDRHRSRRLRRPQRCPFRPPHRPAAASAARPAWTSNPRPKSSRKDCFRPLRPLRHLFGATGDHRAQGRRPPDLRGSSFREAPCARGRRPPCADPVSAGRPLRPRAEIGPLSGLAAERAEKPKPSIRARDAATISALVAAPLPGRRWPRASEWLSGRQGSRWPARCERASTEAGHRLPGPVTAGTGPAARSADRGPPGPIPVIPRAKRGSPSERSER